MLEPLQLRFPLRIFITSRRVPDMERLSRLLKPSHTLICKEIQQEDTMNDVKSYILDRARHLNHNLTSLLLEKAQASFLWARLVADELEKVYSEETMLQIIDTVPEGMIPYYQRVIVSMSKNKHDRIVAKEILSLVVTSSRPLTLTELTQALELNGTKLTDAQMAVEGLCGHLVAASTGVVRLVHLTVRDFLLSEAADDFQVITTESNKTMALTCLRVLSSEEMQAPRTRRHVRRPRAYSPFLEYAALYFSEHVLLSGDEEVIQALQQFFRTNVLSWIEFIAKQGDLYPMTRASKNLKNLAQSKETQSIAGWATDLIKVADQFGGVLLQSPWSIHYLVPPFCPTNTMVGSLASRPDGLKVIGYRESSWDDCSASVTFEGSAVTVSCGQKLIAVGMENGTIELYNARGFQKDGELKQKHPIDLIHFINDAVVISSIRTLSMLNFKGDIIWEARLRFRCIFLTCTATAVVGVTQPGHVIKWDIATGKLLHDEAFDYEASEDDPAYVPALKAPGAAALSPDTELVAFAYRWGAICLWEVETKDLICSQRDTDCDSAPLLLFNSDPKTDLLLVVYKSKLVLYETTNGDLVETQDTSAAVLTVACSSDGQTLASTDTHGTLQLWNFESLSLLYQMVTPTATFRTLKFTSDGLGVIDLVDSGFFVWAPIVLQRENEQDDDSAALASIEGLYETNRISRVTAMCAHPSRPVAFVGKRNGTVGTFDTRTGAETVFHSLGRGTWVKKIIAGEDMVALMDVNNVFQAWSLTKTKLSVKADSVLLHIHAALRIDQMCHSGDYLLVATAHWSRVYSLKDGGLVGQMDFSVSHGMQLWLGVPGGRFALIDGHKVDIFNASDFPSAATSTRQLNINTQDYKQPTISTAVLCPEIQALAVEIHHFDALVLTSTSFLLSYASVTDDDAPLNIISDGFTRSCKHLVGLGDKTKNFFFVDQDSWLCSVDAADLTEGRYTRHFFVPEDYLSAAHQVKPVRTPDDDFVFSREGGLTVIGNGLKFADRREMKA